MSSVWPSGAALAVCSVAMLPPAPARFSTTTGWPQRSPSFWATRRAMMSVPPPGVKPTSMRTGLAGKFGAPAWGKQCEAQVASAARASRATGFCIGAIVLQFLRDADDRPVPSRFEDRVEHGDAVHFVAVGE